MVYTRHGKHIELIGGKGTRHECIILYFLERKVGLETVLTLVQQTEHLRNVHIQNLLHHCIDENALTVHSSNVALGVALAVAHIMHRLLTIKQVRARLKGYCTVGNSGFQCYLNASHGIYNIGKATEIEQNEMVYWHMEMLIDKADECTHVAFTLIGKLCAAYGVHTFAAFAAVR